MLGFLLFIAALILIGFFWRVLLPVVGVLAAIVGIGLLVILATMTDTFAPFKPRPEQIARGCQLPTSVACIEAGFGVDTWNASTTERQAMRRVTEKMIEKWAAATKDAPPVPESDLDKVPPAPWNVPKN